MVFIDTDAPFMGTNYERSNERPRIRSLLQMNKDEIPTVFPVIR